MVYLFTCAIQAMHVDFTYVNTMWIEGEVHNYVELLNRLVSVSPSPEVPCNSAELHCASGLPTYTPQPYQK